ncbi:quinol:cytochrome c oxidoreductase quinone-binding subunit 2 [Saccharicrinis carchari]|uniref:Quinol:cytochrome c oxidoreductase quinone-binding subunit 2 n=2 Tax=Saccharicrinis carchari TaxID=1168039 RepID=A0A521EJJ7_SACCC|nr:quinol:cytochrome c oxidoreductase quinone-binding subunit 2 [Saccharicrinis carchari]
MHEESVKEFKMDFIFPKKGTTVLAAAAIVGLVLTLLGFFAGGIDGHRFWANILLNGFMIIGLCLGAGFFVAVHLISESGWQTAVQRIGEAIASRIWLGALMMILIIFGAHSLYHWTHTEDLDALLQMKQPYLNLPFFIARMLFYLAGWIFLLGKIRQVSLMSDTNPDMKLFYRLRTYSAVFVVFFAITSSTASWDWLMSIDAHWFSTLYGWYTFSGLFVNAIAVIIIFLVVLQKMGYMQHVNEEHMHDMGKYLFGFSIFWAYLWISQYLLIWYANIPEETTYFVTRIKGFETLFYLNLIICFVAPFFALMSRGSKRKSDWLLYVSIIVFMGHWVDLYLAIMPGAVGAEHAHIGLFEIGMTLVYVSVFAWFVFKALTKAKLVPENHPFYKESFDYENIK